MENISKHERSTNFNKNEVRLLAELVANHRTIIDNKKTDAVTNKEKEHEAQRAQSANMRTLKKKQKNSKHRQELYKTDGGPSSGPDFTEMKEKIIAICVNITGLDARHNSDNIPEPIPKSTRIVISETLPLLTDNNIVIVQCDDDVPLTLECIPSRKRSVRKVGEVQIPLC